MTGPPPKAIPQGKGNLDSNASGKYHLEILG